MNILAPFVRWCSTKTNEIGKHIQGNHGFCSPGCPVELVKGINYIIIEKLVTTIELKNTI